MVFNWCAGLLFAYLQAVAGFLIFDEATSLFWWSGILLVLFGLILIVKDQIKDIDDILEESRKD